MSTSIWTEPRILSCHFEEDFDPHFPAFELDWSNTPLADKQTWELPCGFRFVGQPPQRFGVEVLRTGTNSYHLRVLWNQACLQWSRLQRHQILGTSLAEVLAALGTDLAWLLDQPVLPAQPVESWRRAG
jgi:hypothetical protein